MIEKGLRSFIQLINGICKRPAMFQVNNVNDLGILILGFTLALEKPQSVTISCFLSDFNMFVNEHYNTQESYRWDKVIMFFSGSDFDSLQKFNELLEAFILSLSEGNK